MKRILALVLALLSCVGLLSGCGGDTAGDRQTLRRETAPAPASSASLRTVRPRLIRR